MSPGARSPPGVDSFTPARILAISSQLMAGVQYMHANGFAHRDLKPQNVLLSADGRVKICDMGIAIQAKGSRKHHRRQLSVGEKGEDEVVEQGVGTVYYMPPEAFGDHLVTFAEADSAACPSNEHGHPSPMRGGRSVGTGSEGGGSLTGLPPDFAAPPANLGDSNVAPQGSLLPETATKRSSLSSSWAAQGPNYDARVWDAYSLGVMLWELWHREPPWPLRTHPAHRVARKVLAGKRPMPRVVLERDRELRRGHSRAASTASSAAVRLPPADEVASSGCGTGGTAEAVSDSSGGSDSLSSQTYVVPPRILAALWESLWCQHHPSRITVAEATKRLRKDVAPLLRQATATASGGDDPWVHFHRSSEQEKSPISPEVTAQPPVPPAMPVAL